MFLLPEFPQGYLHLLPLQFRLQPLRSIRGSGDVLLSPDVCAFELLDGILILLRRFCRSTLRRRRRLAKRWVKQEVRIPPEYCPTWTLMRWQIRQPPAASLHRPQTPDVQTALKQGCAVLALQLKTPVPVRL